MHHKKQKNIGRMFLSLLQNTLSLFKSIVVPLEQTRSNFVFFFFFFSRDKKPFKFLSLKANRPREASSSLAKKRERDGQFEKWAAKRNVSYKLDELRWVAANENPCRHDLFSSSILLEGGGV